ncbi:MAG: AAA family ATPase [Bacteroidales bacterium]|nr:AAA family ATPase [Bacteroidales bacterium]
MDRIYIVGYMGAGKTTTARRLAQRMGWEVVDTDALFEEKYKISVHDFFNKYDEPLYRKLEAEVLKETEKLKHVVVSTGGGTACYFDNMEWMNGHGTTVFLRINEKSVVDRLLHAKRKRPLAAGKSEVELKAFVNRHYAERLPYYEKAQITVKAEDLDLEGLASRIQELEIP